MDLFFSFIISRATFPSMRWRRSLGIVQCHKWGQARLCTGTHALLHLPISNARRGFPRHGGWRLHTVQTVAHSADEMQKIVDAFSDASKKFGLKINIKKTEVLYQPNSTRTREEDIMVDGNKLNSVLEFTYL